MKKYVFIVPSIIDMGGAQMYTRNRLVDLLEKGWTVDLISAQKGRVYIPELRKYELFIPELAFSYYLYPKKKRNAIVDSIVKRIKDANYDEIVVESTCISESTWAEVIAERCNARHFSYLLQEDNTTTSHAEQEFFKYKLQRHELASITDQSIHDMFATFSPISMEQSIECHLPAYCNNVEEDIDSEWLDKIKSIDHDFLVGCLSRLDKPFVMPSLTSFISFAGLHSDKQFLLVLMGGAPANSNIDVTIRNLFQEVSNVEIIITGYLFPVSTRLLAAFDAFFTSAGSCWVCMRSGIPTISIDGNDFKPIGVLGRTTKSSLFRNETELPLDFSSLMEEILFKKSFEKQGAKHEFNKPDFSEHDAFVNKMSDTKVYFSFEDLPLGFSEKVLSLMLTILGPEKYVQLSILKNNIRKSLSPR